jgi:imidazolonepropionase-like amidohydrolase
MKIYLGFSRCRTWWAAALLFLPLTAQPQVIAVKAKKIFTATHGVIENGVILIRDGKIEDVAAGLEIPWNAVTVDYSKKVVVPGLVEAHAARGYDAANETNPLTPFVTVRDSIDTSHDDFKTALRNGVTALNIVPGNNTILGGLGSLVKSVGLVVEDMLIVPDSGIKISVAGTPQQTRMGVMAQLRRYFNETKTYMEKEKGDAHVGEKMVSTPGSFRSPERVKYESVADLFRGRYKAFVYCESPSDVIRAHELSKKYGFESVYLLGPECYKAAEFIAENKLKVILDPELVYFDRDPLTEEIRRIEVARVFREKNVVFALQSNPLEIHARSLFYQGMQAMNGGLSPEEALRAVTIVPAQFLGVDKLIGSLDKGKLASFAVLDDEPFKVTTKVEFVYIDGKVVYERDKDEELKKLMEGKAIK